jgi:hypothetical protein
MVRATLLFATALASALAQAQDAPKTQTVAKEVSKVQDTPRAPEVLKAGEPVKLVPAPAFFESQDPVEVTLRTNIGNIRGDKGAEPPWRPAELSYKGPEGAVVTIPIKARTRGIWRLKMCDFPPLRLNFSGKESKGTIFHKLDKPKMVSYCKDIDSYDQYILQEFQLYRIYHLLTPLSHKARLLKFVYADSGSGKIRAKRYGFLTEEPSALAARLGGKVLEQKGAQPGDLDPYQDALFGVFQYFIGNTDFSEGALHNVELFFDNQGMASPIAFDFDFAGAVNARYATPDPSLRIVNVRQRLFRGYCSEPEAYAKVFALFNEKKPEIYGLYSDTVGMLMDRGTARETLKYFDEFYEIINNPRAAKRSIIESCIARR